MHGWQSRSRHDGSEGVACAAALPTTIVPTGRPHEAVSVAEQALCKCWTLSEALHITLIAPLKKPESRA